MARQLISRTAGAKNFWATDAKPLGYNFAVRATNGRPYKNLGDALKAMRRLASRPTGPPPQVAQAVACMFGKVIYMPKAAGANARLTI